MSRFWINYRLSLCTINSILWCFNFLRVQQRILCLTSVFFLKIRGARSPKNQDQMKRLLPNLNFSYLNQILLLLSQVATQLFSWDWVDPIPDTIHPETFLGYSWATNLGRLGWQSDVLTTISKRVSSSLKTLVKSC